MNMVIARGRFFGRNGFYFLGIRIAQHTGVNMNWLSYMLASDRNLLQDNIAMQTRRMSKGVELSFFFALRAMLHLTVTSEARRHSL